MEICAVIDSTNTVINLIMATPNDLAPQDCVLIAIPDSNGYQPNIGDAWNGSNFVPQVNNG